MGSISPCFYHETAPKILGKRFTAFRPAFTTKSHKLPSKFSKKWAAFRPVFTKKSHKSQSKVGDSFLQKNGHCWLCNINFQG